VADGRPAEMSLLSKGTKLIYETLIFEKLELRIESKCQWKILIYVIARNLQTRLNMFMYSLSNIRHPASNSRTDSCYHNFICSICYETYSNMVRKILQI